MRMFAFRFVAYSITALAMCGLVIQPAQAQKENQKCVPMLNPATCSSGGNSFCNDLAGGGQCPATSCYYCDDPKTGVANKICLSVEGWTCEVDPNQEEKECSSMANWKYGTCGLNGTCLCLNPAQNGTCGQRVLETPCITP